jgi:hypothetical protein
MPRSLVFLFFLPTVLLAAPALSQDRLHPPARERQREIRKSIEKRFRALYGVRTPTGREALAKALIEEAGGTPLADERYVLLDEARQAAVEAGEAELALDTAETIGAAFLVERFALFHIVLDDLSKRTRGPAELAEVVRRGLKLLSLSAAEEEYDGGYKLASLLSTLARRAGDKSAGERAQHSKDEFRYLGELYREMREAKRELLGDPKNTSRQLAVGAYLAQGRCELEAALPYLARSSDRLLAEIASRDQDGVESAQARLELAEAWWSLGEKKHALAGKENVLPYHSFFLAREFQRRAIHWYKTALPELGAAGRVRREGRVATWGARERTAAAGSGGNAFEDVLEGHALLIGIRYSLGRYTGIEIVASVKPIYRTPHGEVLGRKSRGGGSGSRDVVARPGYAVGGMVTKSALRLDGFRLLFMRLKGARLDPEDSYESEWIGGRGGGPETLLGPTGSLVVGLHGTAGGQLHALGLVTEKPGLTP